MGRCTRKAKTTGDVPLMEVSQSFLGVRTRAKTLALQRFQTAAAATTEAIPDYLELRSRRLEKPPLLKNYQKHGCSLIEKENSTGRSKIRRSVEEFAFAVSGKEDVSFGIGDMEIEASFGENNLDLEARGRSTRESTPSSFIRAADPVTAPGSSTKQRTPSSANQRNIRRNVSMAQEIEEFFAQAEQSQQRFFIEKYNFDVVNDMPLPGRYEWVKVMP